MRERLAAYTVFGRVADEAEDSQTSRIQPMRAEGFPERQGDGVAMRSPGASVMRALICVPDGQPKRQSEMISPECPDLRNDSCAVFSRLRLKLSKEWSEGN